MMDDGVKWLEQEVVDLLDAGPVGLYEFISLLRARWPAEPVESYRNVAAAVLRLVLADGAMQLVRLKWPWEQRTQVPTSTAPQPEDWDDPGDDGMYIAVDSIDGDTVR